jgi:hypothetical protein
MVPPFGGVVNYFFLVLLIGVTAYALVAGGAPERIGAAVYVAGTEATHLVLATHVGHRWLQVETGVFIVDVVTLLAFAALALRSDRFWPIWVSALLGLAVLGHLARWWMGGEIVWYAYAFVSTIWSYPILAIIALGTWNHQRRRAGVTAPRATT